MKKINKILSVALVAVMLCATLVGCGKEVSASGDVFKIGGIGPTTGDAASYGLAVKNDENPLFRKCDWLRSYDEWSFSRQWCWRFSFI